MIPPMTEAATDPRRGIAGPTSLRLLAGLFVLAGIAHFIRPAAYIGIMPAWIPAHAAMVAISGVAEIIGGLGVLAPTTRRAAGIGLILLLIAVFPANIQMLLNGTHDAKPAWYLAALWLRLPLQPLMVWWIWRATLLRPQRDHRIDLRGAPGWNPARRDGDTGKQQGHARVGDRVESRHADEQ